ncbi:MAG: hypothetical protein S4CHLAM123_15550 [Chlamydiales bacterium]|nr:hypothetical protein [Chlamydiales bacterium]
MKLLLCLLFVTGDAFSESFLTILEGRLNVGLCAVHDHAKVMTPPDKVNHSIKDCLHINSEESSCVSCLDSIPVKDRLALEHFFRILTQNDGLGYTLFGSKPVCLSNFFMKVPFGNMLYGCHSNAIRLGWKTWKKYEKHFPHPQFIVFDEKENVKGIEIINIYFINKINVLKTLNENLDVFSSELEKEIHPESFISEIEQEYSLSQLLNNHEGLLGILLGYGVESSMHYHERNHFLDKSVPMEGCCVTSSERRVVA